MFRRDVCAPLVQHLNPKIRYMGGDNNLHALDGLGDIYALVMLNIKLSRERHSD